jgi:predicted acyltransferase
MFPTFFNKILGLVLGLVLAMWVAYRLRLSWGRHIAASSRLWNTEHLTYKQTIQVYSWICLYDIVNANRMAPRNKPQSISGLNCIGLHTIWTIIQQIFEIFFFRSRSRRLCLCW